MKAIVVPLDGSELSERALPLTGVIATKRNAEVVLTTAITAGDRWVDDGFVRQWESDEQAAVESYQRSIIDRLQKQGVRARAHREWGQPQAVIESVADKEGAGLIVMTTHGRSGVSRWTLGSVADKVLRTTNMPLILIHPTADAPVPGTQRGEGMPGWNSMVCGLVAEGPPQIPAAGDWESAGFESPCAGGLAADGDSVMVFWLLGVGEGVSVASSSPQATANASSDRIAITATSLIAVTGPPPSVRSGRIVAQNVVGAQRTRGGRLPAPTGLLWPALA